MIRLALRRSFVTVVILLTAVAEGRAQEWVGTTDSNWANANNWNPTTVPTTGSTATFDNPRNGNTNISLGGTTQQVNTLSFNTATAAAYNIGVLNSGDTLSFDAGGSIAVDSTVTNVETISAKIVTNGDMTLSISSATPPPTGPGLKIEGGIDLAAGSFLNVGPTSGTTGTSGAITIDRPITGGGFLNSTIRTGSLNINAQNTYSGGTFFNATNGGEQPAIRFSVDSVGSPGAVTSGPFGTGTITTQSGNPAVFQPVGGDRTIANDWTFTNAIFVGSLASAPYLTGETGHNLFLTGNVTLGASGRVLTNNLPAGTALYFGGSTVAVSPSNLTLGNTLTFQTQTGTSGNGGGVAIINDSVVNGSGTGALTVQNSATLILNNPNNTYTGNTTVTGSGGVTAGAINPTLIINGAKTGAGTVTINSRCGTGTGTACSATNTTLVGIGVLAGTGSIAGTVNNVGILSPGSSAGAIGTLTFTSGPVNDTGIAQAHSHWAIDINGANSDKIAVTGNISLAGIDDLDVTGTGSPGTNYVIATYTGTLTGTFDTLNIPSGYTINYGTGTNSQITLTVPAGLAGDYNGNGVVDAADYVMWRKNPSGFGGDPAGYNTWRGNFGNTSGGGSSLRVGAVPEPNTVLLIMAGFLLGVGRQRLSVRTS